MKGFLGAFLVFLLWSFTCIYYVSAKEPSPFIEKNSSTTISNSNDKQPITKPTKTSTSNSEIKTTDSISKTHIDREASIFIAEEIQKSIAISDTVDFTKDEPVITFEKELNLLSGPSFSSEIFYPQYNNTDLILDKELVAYASELKELLKNNPDKKVTILGHTDNVGNARDNFSTGLKKSRQIKWYLTARRGIPRSKITATSRGEEEPIASNNTVSGRRQNNRIEIIVD
ncbi:OmpA family protein [Dokdonia donghaensis]|uniref:OmpA family protein n=1 Tax=Dokdonia donghaensis TaxID=326320 RepID=UPI00068983D6|nr:OmpA family protein [Dokdonia donghaensis]ANH60891.1 Peptidoglycan-binding protein ArfA [Dokdonia donghaensis DSW-1]